MSNGYEPNFDRDLQRGAQGELFVDRIATALATQRSETKTDSWWLKSNKLFIETECLHADGKWHPSGINKTTAPIWCTVAGRHQVMMALATEHLRRAVAYAVKRDPRNGKAAQNRGKYKTRGVFVWWHDIIETRDKSLDEH